MKLLRLLLLGLLAIITHSAYASHILTGALSYQYLRTTSVGLQEYQVQVDMYTDCAAGTTAPQQLAVRCDNTITGFTQTITAVASSPAIPNPYGFAAQVQGGCLTGYPQLGSFRLTRYTGTVSLAAGQWVLSVREVVRAPTANLAANEDFYTQATLDNRGGVVNTAAVFAPLPIAYVTPQQPSLLYSGAFDADGDSLAYSLTAPLGDYQKLNTYNSYSPAACQGGVLSSTPPCLLQCPPATGRYRAAWPMAVLFDTVGACPQRRAMPKFEFDSLTGVIALTAAPITSTSAQPASYRNAVSVAVTEWRKISGVYVLVGQARRDMLVVVYGTATMPRLSFAPTAAVQSGTLATTQPLSRSVYVRAGEPATVTATATSSVAGASLSYTLDQNVVPGASIQTINGQGRLSFTPPLTLPNGTYRVSLTATDAATPVRNTITVPVTFRVYRGATPLTTRLSRIALAELPWPTPFTDAVQFRLAHTGVQPVVISDQLGRVVATLCSATDGTVRWQPATELPAGLYLARTADGQQTARLLRSQQ